MDYFAKLVIAALAAFFSSFAFAGYAQLAPPSGWAPFSGGGASGVFSFGPASNAAKLLPGGTVATNAALNVGGSAIRVPVALRYAANASRFAAGYIFPNPYLIAGAAVVAWLASNSLKWSEEDNAWVKVDTNPDYDVSDGYEYFVSLSGFPVFYSGSKKLVCDNFSVNFFSVNVLGDRYSNRFHYISGDFCFVSFYDNETKRTGVLDFRFSVKPGSCPVGWYVTPAGCLQRPPPQTVTEQEFIDILSPSRFPKDLPLEVPFPLPVDDPSINPGPDGDPPYRPFFIPTGDPVPNPHYNPSKPASPDNEPYIRPGVSVNPSPVPDNPWRVTLNPVNRPTPNNEPSKGPEFNPSGNPSGQPNSNPGGNPGGNPNGGDRPMDNPGLCDEYPDILACAKMDEPPEKDLEEVKKDIKISPDSGWGADDAACPAPKSIHPQGHTIMIPYDLFCVYMRGMRPIIIAMAWLSAAFILIGARESS